MGKRRKVIKNKSQPIGYRKHGNSNDSMPKPEILFLQALIKYSGLVFALKPILR